MARRQIHSREAGTTLSADPVVSVPLTPYEDAYEFNLGFKWETSSGLPKYIVDMLGGTERDNPVRPHGQNVPNTVSWQLDSSAALTPNKKGVITYSFLDTGHTTAMYNNPKEGFTEGFGYTSFSEEQRDAARIAINNWDELVAVSFVEVQGEGDADITMANTTTGPAQAHAYIPHDYAGIYGPIIPQYNYLHRWQKFLGDVWVADPYAPAAEGGNSSNAQLDPGQYGLQTLNHELGHSLGLSHPGNYNFSDDTDGDGEPDPITYTGDAQYFQDSHQFTIMSYFDAYETGAQYIDWNVMRFIYPSTPMVDDVLVIQQKYGVDTTTRTGNDTYGFNATAGVTNEAMRFAEGETFAVFTIWDAGGNDTLDLSGYHTDSIIDLREGGYSSAGGVGAYVPAELGTKLTLAQINANNADLGYGPRTERLYEIYHNGNYQELDEDGEPMVDEDGNPVMALEGLSWKEVTGTSDDYLMEQNIGIAYGAIIENAVGGHGNDRINGNQANNNFTGGAGADTFIFADYDGVLPTPTGTKTVVDNSIDTVTDFETGVDKIDLTEFGADLDFVDLHFNTVGTTNTISFDRNGDGTDDYTFVITGTVVETDFLFG